MKILLLEDDRLYNETIADFLEDEGFRVDGVLDPLTAYDLAYENSYDLYIFDINLPFEDGIKALESLRNSGDNTPTIFITSRTDKESLLNAFSAGAEDYLKKPIDLDELLARVEVIKRRYILSNVIKIGRYVFDSEIGELYLDGRAQGLRRKEGLLLGFLVKFRDRVVRYDELYSLLWDDNNTNYGALRVYISNLKKHFPNIKSIRSVGYKFSE